MPLTQNVSGTLKKITKLTQNVSGVLKPNNSFKMNVNGVLKELLDTLPSSLTWTADNGAIAASNVTIKSTTNNGLTVSARLCNSGYTSIGSTNFSAAPKIYSNTFYLSAGNTVTIAGTLSSEQTSPSAVNLLLYLYNVDTGKLYSVTSTKPYEITVSGNYYIVISGFTFIATGSASGVSYSYGYVNVGGTVSFAESASESGGSGGTTVSDINMLTTYTALAASLSGTAYSNSSNTVDSNSATISVDTSKYKYLDIAVKTTSYISVTCSCIVIMGGITVAELDLTGAAGTTQKTVTIASSGIANKTLTSCRIELYCRNGTSTSVSVSATPTVLKFYN